MTLPKPFMTTLYVLGSLAAVLFIALLAVLVIGARIPREHTTTVTGTVEASPERVFAIIADIAEAPAWRKQVVSVEVLPPDDGRDHWVEDLGHNRKTTFLAIRSVPPGPNGHGLREILMDDPGASYGGTWTYKLVPGPSPNQTILQITEDGYIDPWIYRFAMVHVFGLRSNLETYMHSLQAVTNPKKL
jgi:hypothetical protein